MSVREFFYLIVLGTVWAFFMKEFNIIFYEKITWSTILIVAICLLLPLYLLVGEYKMYRKPFYAFMFSISGISGILLILIDVFYFHVIGKEYKYVSGKYMIHGLVSIVLILPFFFLRENKKDTQDKSD